MKEEKKRRLYVEERMVELDAARGDMSYENYFKRDYNQRKQELTEEKRMTDLKLGEIRADIYEARDAKRDDSELRKMFHVINNKSVELEKEIARTSCDVSIALLSYAKELDNYKLKVEEFQDLRKVAMMLNESIDILIKLNTRNGGWYKSSRLAEKTYWVFFDLVQCFNTELPKVVPPNLTNLQNKMIEIMDEVEREKNNKQGYAEKYKDIIPPMK